MGTPTEVPVPRKVKVRFLSIALLDRYRTSGQFPLKPHAASSVGGTQDIVADPPSAAPETENGWPPAQLPVATRFSRHTAGALQLRGTFYASGELFVPGGVADKDLRLVTADAAEVNDKQ